MTDLPRQIRLAAGDYFMHGQDYRMRRAGLPGNVCRVVVRLEKGLDVDRLRQQVAASPISSVHSEMAHRATERVCFSGAQRRGGC
jgi:hypothetical protein